MEFLFDGLRFDVISLLTSNGIDLISAVILPSGTRAVVRDEQIAEAIQLLFRTGIDYTVRDVTVNPYVPGRRGEFARIVSTNPRTLYLGEDNTIITYP